MNMDDMVCGAQALANEKRLLILEWLKTPASHFGPEHPFDEAEGVCGLYIAQKLGISPASTSVHLKILTQAGLVRPLRVGKFTYFRRVEPAIAALAKRIAAL
jgi:ArsR family transcriptional regulator